MPEPPDLKNWFPSYQYESPALNSDSFLDNVGTHETEREEKEEISGRDNAAFIRKKQNPNGVVESGSSSICCRFQVVWNRLRSFQPTDIGNWFSSYVYESPLLDTTNAFGDSVCKEGKHQKDGVSVENSNSGKEKEFRINGSDSKETVGENLQSEGLVKCNISLRDHEQERQLVSETPGPLQSPALLSEPIDIRNWFSSYVYESPSFDTTDGFGDSVCKEIRSGKDGFLVENGNSEKEDLEGFSEKRTDDEEVADLKLEGLAKCMSSWRNNTQEKQPVNEGRPSGGVNENLPSQNDFFLKYMPKSLDNQSPAQGVEISILNKESSQCEVEPKISNGTKRNSCSNAEKSPQYITIKDFTLQENSEAKFQAESKPNHGRKDRKDDGNDISENGFITTRKGKVTRKNERPLEISKAAATLTGGREVVVKRKALADATNFHHSPVTEITGKWKCPQRSKPNPGSSLKQLRLEKWVRKL